MHGMHEVAGSIPAGSTTGATAKVAGAPCKRCRKGFDSLSFHGRGSEFDSRRIHARVRTSTVEDGTIWV